MTKRFFIRFSDSAVRNSIIILTPGAVVLILSFIPKTAAALNTKTAQKISIVIGLAAILFAAIN